MKEINPTYLDEVILELIKFIPSSDLCSLRLISKQWNQLATKVLRRRRNFAIHLNGDFIRNMKFLDYLNFNVNSQEDEHDIEVLPPVLKLTTRNILTHGQNIPIQDDLEKYQIAINSQELHQQICQILGSLYKITHLVINFCSCYQSTVVQYHLKELMKNLGPSLRVLEIQNLPGVNIANVYHIPEILEEIEIKFSKFYFPWEFPSIEKLMVIAPDVRSGADCTSNTEHSVMHSTDFGTMLIVLIRQTVNIREIEVNQDSYCGVILELLMPEDKFHQLRKIKLSCVEQSVLKLLQEHLQKLSSKQKS